MTDQEAADAEFGSRLREIMGAAVQSVADQAGPELAIAIAQRLDAGEWQLRTTVNLDGGRAGRVHASIPCPRRGRQRAARAVLRQVAGARRARGIRSGGSPVDGLAEPFRSPRRPVGIGLAFLTGRRNGPPAPAGRLAGDPPHFRYGSRLVVKRFTIEAEVSWVNSGKRLRYTSGGNFDCSPEDCWRCAGRRSSVGSNVCGESSGGSGDGA